MDTAHRSDEFRFSPRPNRAHEIAWLPWGPDAFARAQAEDKPVLLSISAVWCHWCHVMDETTYSDAAVMRTIAERYIAVRVDNDRRPDVNARYNMGGWPTTAVLTPSGDTITGATYIAPDQMVRFLDDVVAFFETNRADIEAQVAGAHAPAPIAPAAAEPLGDEIIANVTEAIASGYDPEFGGFGTEPKFPQTDALEFLLRELRIARAAGNDDGARYEMLARTALAMSRSGMYDHVEGGFFRYSTTRDWSVPHFEKMSEDHGGLLRFYAGLYRISNNGAFRETLQSATRYVRTVLRDPQSGRFAGSQDADEAYFTLPLDERRTRPAPFVDRTCYVNWTCNLASGLLAAATVLDDDDLGAVAIAAIDAVVASAMIDDDGLVRHYIATDGSAHVRGLLTDQTWLLRALLDAHAYDGEPRHRETALALADAVLQRFASPGGFVDAAYAAQGVGRTTLVDRPLVDNGHLCDALLRLAAISDEERYADAARHALAAFVPTYRRAGSFAAAYAGAVRRALALPVVVTLVGTTGSLANFREIAAAHPNPLADVRSFAPGDPRRTASGFPADAPRAYVCIGRTCSAPIATPAGFHDAYMVFR